MRRVLFFFKLSSPWDFFSCPLLTVVEFHNLYVISFPEDIRTSTCVANMMVAHRSACTPYRGVCITRTKQQCIVIIAAY